MTSLFIKYGGKLGFVRHLKESLLGILGVYDKYKTLPASTQRIVFVCKGNICRSALAAKVTKAHTSIPVESFGLYTHTGKPANERISRIAESLGYDLRDHRTLAVEDFVFSPGDLYVCFDRAHCDEVKKYFPEADIVLFGFHGNPRRLYIHDPYSAETEYANFICKYIIECSSNLAKQLCEKTEIIKRG